MRFLMWLGLVERDLLYLWKRTLKRFKRDSCYTGICGIVLSDYWLKDEDRDMILSDLIKQTCKTLERFIFNSKEERIKWMEERINVLERETL